MTEKQLQQLANKYLDITLPTSKAYLKRVYRYKCLKLHPDKGGNEEYFKDFQNAFETLLYSKSNVVFDGSEIVKETADGTPITELGLGIGYNKNGIECNICKGNGYEISYNVLYKVCNNCLMGYVPKTYPCRACNGTGLFVQARSKKTVPCKRCCGTGLWEHPSLTKPCPKCCGTMTIHDESKIVNYIKCYKCKGTGEIEMFNPVLRKGLLKVTNCTNNK